MTKLQSDINEALEHCLGQYLSIEARQKIAGQYGEEVAAQVTALYEEALNCPVDWRTATMDDGLAVLGAVLDKYPWLSKRARGSLVHTFIMAWK